MLPRAEELERNPYQSLEITESRPAPERDSDAEDELPREARRFRWIAVLVGYGSDYLLTKALDSTWWFYLGLRVSNGGTMPSDDARLAMVSFLGSSSSVVGGFVCGFVAKHDEVKHGVVQLVLGFTIFMLQVWQAGGWGLPTWYYVVTIPAVALATVTGAWLAGLWRRRR